MATTRPLRTPDASSRTPERRASPHALRILFTVKKRGWNGETAHVLDLAIGCRRAGHEVTIATRTSSMTAHRARESGIRVLGLELKHATLAVRTAWEDVKRLRIELAKTDVVHTHASWDTWLVAAARRSTPNPPPMLRTRHNLKPIRTHALNRRLYAREITCIVAPSRTIAADVARYPFIDVGRVRTIPHGIDLRRFSIAPAERQQARLQLRAAIGAAPDAHVVGFVGRATRRKRADLFLEVAERLVGERPNVYFVVAGQVGGGSAWCDEFRARIDGLGRRARALGFVEDVPGLLAGLDIVVHPAPDEAFGLAAVEASAMEAAVVAAGAGGTAETIDDGHSGLLFQPDDAADCARHVDALLTDPALRARLAEAARARVERKYDATRMLADYLRLLGRITQERNAVLSRIAASSADPISPSSTRPRAASVTPS